ncbi:sugar-transfer associated ATP-grasp domain-containing protein [Fodinibius saliphilus]|uniref:sugar-transfer associated ATP-grasp domain-containing protein n=1 Tax=Fodinibius saliphilus TaxID=1920650 RepID=UPI0011097501|nr:sugar-transfer associated ATP-grasp domain-containing protein [Fodinibius saliphilus]
MKLKRVIYLGYYIKQLNRTEFLQFLDYTSKVTGKSKVAIVVDMLKSVFIYNISVLEYFQFRFYKRSKGERKLWAGTGYMYEYQLKMNPRNRRHILEDKTLFYKNYGDFLIHTVADREDLKNSPAVAETILTNKSGRLVFKPKEGKCGLDIEIRRCEEFNREGLIKYMEINDYALVEEFLVQHPELKRLSPSGVNTVRIFTQLNDRDEVIILGCRLRISVNSPVDNMAAGNLAAPIDEDTGRLSGPGVYSDITKDERMYHPVTSVKIPGFQVPFWEETMQMVKHAALHHKENRSIGWDVVITKEGPGLIEGNHDWCKLLWQLPAKEGLKSALKQYN